MTLELSLLLVTKIRQRLLICDIKHVDEISFIDDPIIYKSGDIDVPLILLIDITVLLLINSEVKNICNFLQLLPVSSS